MSDSRSEFLKAVALQRLNVVFPEGRPSATPSVEIKDSGGVIISADATTNVTQDTVNTTVASAAAIGAEVLTLASAVGIVAGRTYRLTSADGPVEDVRVLEISGAVVTLDEPLARAYAGAGSDTFQSTRAYYTMQTVDVAQLREGMQATWTYVVDSLNYTLRQIFDVVLHVLPNPLTRDALAIEYPDVFSQEQYENRGSDFQRQRDLAWSQVNAWLRKRKVRLALVPDDADLMELARWHLTGILTRSGIEVLRGFDDQESMLRYIDEKIETAREESISGLSAYDADESGDSDEDEVADERLTWYR